MITLTRCTITTTRITRITTSVHISTITTTRITRITTSYRISTINPRLSSRTQHKRTQPQHNKITLSHGDTHTYMHTIAHTRVTQDTRIRSIRVWPLARSTGIQIRCKDMSRAHESPESQPNKPQPLNTSTRDYHRDYKIRDIHHSTHTYDHTTKR
jgi:hypothetical protein